MKKIGWRKTAVAVIGVAMIGLVAGCSDRSGRLQPSEELQSASPPHEGATEAEGADTAASEGTGNGQDSANLPHCSQPIGEVAAISEGDSITVTWKSISGAETYKLFKSAVGEDLRVGSSFDDGPITEVYSATPAETLTYVDRDVPADMVYIYWIKAEGSCWAGENSSYVSRIPFEHPSQNVVATWFSGTTRGVPEESIIIRGDPVMDAAGYKIYRKKGAGLFTYIGTASASRNGFEYHDMNPDDTISYAYCVRAVDRMGNEGPASRKVNASRAE